MYGMPDEIDVTADGALRIITLNRPDALNAVNDNLHVGLAKIWETVVQLRGQAGPRQVDGARTGLIQLIGAGNVCLIHILQRV